jgi:transketolase
MDATSACELGTLRAKANRLRQRVITTLGAAGGGHVGGSLSAADLLTALYSGVLRVDPRNPRWEDRDRFILSKGHAGVALYCALAEAGFFSPDLLSTFNTYGSPLGTHPDMRKIPGVDMSAGALGHGLSVGVGMAIAGRLAKKEYRVFVMLGDGEICEGSVWEAAMAAGHYHLDRLVAIVDYNRLSLDGPLEKVMELEPLADKWRAFGWGVREIDGHDMEAVTQALGALPVAEGRPSVILAHTTKGKGVSFCESVPAWHSISLDQAAVDRALRELQAQGGAR